MSWHSLIVILIVGRRDLLILRNPPVGNLNVFVWIAIKTCGVAAGYLP